MRNFTHVDDIVNGLLLVAEKGQGDNYGIGADESFSVLDVARMFGGEIMMMPPRKGNRMLGGVDNEKVKALGWTQQHTLPAYIETWKSAKKTPSPVPLRILVFTTTFFPVAGAAECALEDLMRAMPQAHFDVVTTMADGPAWSLPNATLYRVGRGSSFDKYLLPFLGSRVARKLVMEHEYAFMWSLFASYGALAALRTKWKKRLPHLITLADQRLDSLPWYTRLTVRWIIGEADQIYTDDVARTRAVSTIGKRATLVRSIGKGDALANQIRFAYSNMLRTRIGSQK
jgi:hypothetical protein